MYLHHNHTSHFTSNQVWSALQHQRVSASRWFLSCRAASFLTAVSSHDRPPRCCLPHDINVYRLGMDLYVICIYHKWIVIYRVCTYMLYVHHMCIILFASYVPVFHCVLVQKELRWSKSVYTWYIPVYTGTYRYICVYTMYMHLYTMSSNVNTSIYNVHVDIYCVYKFLRISVPAFFQ